MLIHEITSGIDARYGRGSIDGPKALVYLYRRFGFTDQGSGDYKEVCRYAIETPLKDTYIVVIIGAKRARIHWAAEESLYERATQEICDSNQSPTPFVQSCIDAAGDCLRDLRRPIRVRDQAITIFGEATDEDCNNSFCDASHMAGYGVPSGAFVDPDLFHDFMDVVKFIGGGDVAAGMKRVMKMEKENE